jgi:3-oxoacyl-[acyl-carrier protein] reductase
VAITHAKDGDAASAMVKAIQRDGGNAIAILADAADAKAVNAVVDKTVATFGQLDVLPKDIGERDEASYIGRKQNVRT